MTAGSRLHGTDVVDNMTAKASLCHMQALNILPFMPALASINAISSTPPRGGPGNMHASADSKACSLSLPSTDSHQPQQAHIKHNLIKHHITCRCLQAE
jgi:hypothetical protein